MIFAGEFEEDLVPGPAVGGDLRLREPFQQAEVDDLVPGTDAVVICRFRQLEFSGSFAAPVFDIEFEGKLLQKDGEMILPVFRFGNPDFVVGQVIKAAGDFGNMQEEGFLVEEIPYNLAGGIDNCQAMVHYPAVDIGRNGTIHFHQERQNLFQPLGDELPAFFEGVIFIGQILAGQTSQGFNLLFLRKAETGLFIVIADLL